MHLLPRINVIFYFICRGAVELPGARKKRKLQNEKFLSIMGFEPTHCRAAPAYKSSALST